MNAILLLQLLETGHQEPGSRARLLHRIASGGEELAVVPDATLGKRAWDLLRWREPHFGVTMACIADCPQCGERVEFDLRRSDLAQQPPMADPPEVRIREGGFQLAARVPRIGDIDLANGNGAKLLGRCVTSAKKGSRSIAVEDVPALVRERLEEAIVAADPLMAPQIGLDCPSCAHNWSAPFDVVSYCWSELERWAQHLMGSVHRLASAYGWSERDVLAMSAWRRDHYLQLLAS